MEFFASIDCHVAIVLAAVLGLAVGSWLTTVVHRLPKMLEYDWENVSDEARLAGLPPRPSLWRAGSQCPVCGTAIRGWRRIPILGWWLLRGHCDACEAPIAWRYPTMELLTAVFFALCVWRFGSTMATLYAMVLIAALVALAWIDAETGLLPDAITLPLLWVGLLVNTQHVFTSPTQAILGATVGYVFLRGLARVFYWASGREGMGGGDFKLLAALGAWFGVAALPLILIIASLAGIIVGMAFILVRRLGRNQPQPFGPYLALAGMVGLMMASLPMPT